MTASPLDLQVEIKRQSAARLLFRSHWNLNTETGRDEPRLRRLLGHISVYDRTKAFTQEQSKQNVIKPEETEELSAFLQQQVPSFEEFRAALKLQLETISQVRVSAATQLEDVDEYDSDDSDDSDYDSYDGERSDDESAAESDDSLTDNDSEGQLSPCASPTCESPAEKFAKEDEQDIWAIRPLTPFLISNRITTPS